MEQEQKQKLCLLFLCFNSLSKAVCVNQVEWRETRVQYLQTSLLLEKRESLMTSGAIQAYVPAALILVVWCHSLARPKSVIFRVFPIKSSRSTGSRMRTEEEEEDGGMINEDDRDKEQFVHCLFDTATYKQTQRVLWWVCKENICLVL